MISDVAPEDTKQEILDAIKEEDAEKASKRFKGKTSMSNNTVNLVEDSRNLVEDSRNQIVDESKILGVDDDSRNLINEDSRNLITCLQ
jgi:hypothetical protein